MEHVLPPAEPARAVLRPRDVLELLKPVTWFPPMWAFMCGVVSSGVPLSDRWALLIAGMILAGPLVCGNSQAINDWFDRHVDAINEPQRPIPSGRIPGRWGLYIACIGTIISLAVGFLIGPVVGVATIVGVAMAWAYSAPPLRFKADGWLGPLVCAAAYEGVSWFTGAAVMAGGVVSSGRPAIMPKQTSMPPIGTMGTHGVRKGRGTLGWVLRRMMTLRQTSTKAAKVPMATSSIRRFSGRKADSSAATMPIRIVER